MIKIDFGPYKDDHFGDMNYGKFLSARLLATCTTLCHRWISLEHDY